ncbi:MAG: hydrogenase maturation nickel metallochaperone HypA [Candidatus Latescibacteria bacterium]|nr:hydrogenase maturation nickel metallochaperone HypA [Candidatus Latescibacterota bacterium]
MHELSITQSIFSQALAEAKKHKAKRIKKIKLQVGEGAGIVPDCVRFYYDTLKKGTIAEPSVLEFEIVPLKLRCPQCHKEVKMPEISDIDLNSYKISCDCNKGVEIISGNDMIIEYIDIE